MEHSFDITIAKKYGVHSAILLKNIQYWIQKNAANNVHFHDGAYWTYNSGKAFSKLFPYMTEEQIRYALKKLVDDGILMTGNFNDRAFDRTVWYTITKTGYSILHICEIEENINSDAFGKIPESISENSQINSGKFPNASGNFPEPIPNNKPNINADINTLSDAHADAHAGDKPPESVKKEKHFVPPTAEEVRAYCEERGNTVNPEEFVDFYASKGWMVGKNRMKDWKAAVRTWERNRQGIQKKPDSGGDGWDYIYAVARGETQ